MEFNSIQDFKSNFSHIYHGNVKQKLNAFENEKNITKKQIALLRTIVIIGACILSYFVAKDFSFAISQQSITTLLSIAVTTLMICIVVKASFKKKFEKALKASIMPEVMKAFGNFIWTTAEVIQGAEIKDSTLYERFEDKDDDDNFYGTYKGLNVNIDETELTYTTRDSEGHQQRQTEFKGVIISVDVKKPFKGHTVVRERYLFNSSRYEEIKLEDPEFTKKYFVSGTDQIESRYLMTTSFIERFKNIQRAFKANSIEASFKHNKMILALSTSKDLFSLGNLDRPIDDTKQFSELLDEFVSILAIIDELKLNQNIGL